MFFHLDGLPKMLGKAQFIPIVVIGSRKKIHTVRSTDPDSDT